MLNPSRTVPVDPTELTPPSQVWVLPRMYTRPTTHERYTRRDIRRTEGMLYRRPKVLVHRVLFPLPLKNKNSRLKSVTIRRDNYTLFTEEFEVSNFVVWKQRVSETLCPQVSLNRPTETESQSIPATILCETSTSADFRTDPDFLDEGLSTYTTIVCRSQGTVFSTRDPGERCIVD